tara:strand:+ start:228 stop:1646 length:1419 start_codon:yes stop_codon:yes gene_type:complete
MKFSIVVATDKDGGIGLNKNNKYSIPWSNALDMKFFKDLTSSKDIKKVIIMGKNTYFSLPIDNLPNRTNIVITSNPSLITNKDVFTYTNLNEALKFSKQFDEIYVIGGSQLYKEALKHESLDKIYWNIINKTNEECNIKFPLSFEDVQNHFILDKQYDLSILNSDDIKFYKFLSNKNTDESKYLGLLDEIMKYGNERKTRNSITKSLFGKQLTFDLKDKFPLLTTKKMFLRGIFEELIWFLKGDTNSKILENKKVNIWKWNSTQDFIDSQNLPYKEGDIGAMYGFQLNHAGTQYIDCNTNYKDKGFNQVQYCLDLLKIDKYSRRIIMTTYIPHEASKGVLYPCHGITIQFYVKEVDNINYLSCHMYQRSADMFLGVPFNIASYSLIVYMFCHILNNDSDIKFVPDELTISFGDVHIYSEHYEQVKEQVSRTTKLFPQINFKQIRSNLEDFVWEDIEIESYNPHPSIKAEMVA